MASPEFAKNPLGVDFDPNDVIKRLKAGESEASIKKRANISPRGLSNIPVPPPRDVRDNYDIHGYELSLSNTRLQNPSQLLSSSKWLTGRKRLTDFTTADTLHKDLSSPPSKFHDGRLESVEHEILEFFKCFGNFLNHVAYHDAAAGKESFELKDYAIFDLIGTVSRPNLEAHYDRITLYLGKTHQQFREVEITAVTKDFGYIIAVQKVDGIATDGSPYDMSYRTTSLVRKVDGAWKYVHESYSFPVDMATK
ncbi:hypothetical protein FANTH_10152 [Fusarium anthophilum]|uniref:SnoaL-like domain-containing protein n=1 Tax=Fusarium anthophilum TaxID=48485 RepID=A0A8H4Z2U6_9HYPO|nr:hypothetical protein FANTH_10152 [Fusarium anthophilum]